MDPNRRFLFAAGVVLIVVTGMAALSAVESQLIDGHGLESLVMELGQWGTWLMFSPLMLWMTRRLPLNSGRPLRFVLIHAAAGTVLSFGHLVLRQHLPGLARYTYSGSLMMPLSWELVHYAQLILVCYVIDFFVESKARAIESLRLREEISRLEFDSLKYQVRPEFLLETIGRIRDLLFESAERADRAIVSLGDTLRKNLDGRMNAGWSVEEPLRELHQRLAEMKSGKQPTSPKRMRQAIWIFCIWASVIGFFLARNGVIAWTSQQGGWSRTGWIAVPWAIWGLLTPVVLWLAAKFPWEKPAIAANIGIHAVAAVCLWLVAEILSASVLQFSPMVSDHSFGAVLVNNIRLFGFMTDIPTYFTIVLVHHTIRRFRSDRQNALRLLELRVSFLDARLRTLQMQIQPHFLYNTLHSISELVHEDSLVALKMLDRLERFFQLTLENPTEQAVALDRELEFLRCYLEIQKVRFQDSLFVLINVDERSREARVPNLILQPIVENAIRHGAPQNGGRKITITAATRSNLLELQVQDNGPGLNASGNKTREGLGLSNVRVRLQQLYGDPHLLDLRNLVGGGLLVTVLIPLQPAI